MRYDRATTMTERAVEISETYTPGKYRGKTRTVTVDRIPAFEVTVDDQSDTQMDFDVCVRVDELIERALGANDLAEQRVTYSASDPEVPVAAGPAAKRYPRHRPGHVPASGGQTSSSG